MQCFEEHAYDPLPDEASVLQWCRPWYAGVLFMCR